MPGSIRASDTRRRARRLVRTPAFLAGAGLVALMLLLSAAAPLVAPYDYAAAPKFQGNRPPSHAHLLGTDQQGHDILSRILAGGRVTLAIALAATAASIFIGVAVGLASALTNRWADGLLMRFTDMVYAFPGLLLALALAAIFERRSVFTILLALGLVGWVSVARVMRAECLRLRESDFVTAARALGASRWRIALRHVLPNTFSSLIVVATLLVASNVLSEAGLSFLGLGVADPPSWGMQLAEARDTFRIHPYQAIFPGLAIAATVLGFNRVGDGLAHALAPRRASGRTRA